jgi:hypothetical protein
MAKPHTPEKGPTNPEVRFERSDIEPGAVLRWGLSFAAAIAAAALFVLFIAPRLVRSFEPLKKTDLPPMAAEARPPEAGPRLEGIEDLEKRTPHLLPPRAAYSLTPQRRELDEGGPKAVPIADAMAAMTRLLPAGKEPPREFMPRLPSAAAAGRQVEGGGK